ncbi:MAG: CRISPR-associated endoribonuclease Cas6 [Methanobacterium sp.]|nr:CRISPR-associated endoribonuclease Cas6 [Methanobacterium sp.]MDY9922310.1 CRISPR-associated endoribonuclease Cas6 [Methanobacterium sp.]
MADLDLASQLHASQDFKHFTFSQINIPRRRPSKNGLISKNGKFHFYISSPHDYLIQSMVEGYLEDPEINFKGDRFRVEQVELLKQPDFKKKMKMKTMSPVIVRIKREDGRIWDLNPGDLRFYTALQQNLIRKYNSFYGDYNGDEFVKIVLDMDSVKRKRITIEKSSMETYHRAYLMHFEVEADERLVKFVYDTGLGEKNSMGFGMVEMNNGRNKYE